MLEQWAQIEASPWILDHADRGSHLYDDDDDEVLTDHGSRIMDPLSGEIGKKNQDG